MEQFRDVPAFIEHDRIRRRSFFQKRFDGLRLFANIDSKDDKPVILVIVMDRFQRWQSIAAGAAPNCPEIQENVPTSK